jgi:hypothetical protein
MDRAANGIVVEEKRRFASCGAKIVESTKDNGDGRDGRAL